MRTASILYFLGVFTLAIGIAVAAKEPSAIPVIIGIGILIASLVKFLEGK